MDKESGERRENTTGCILQFNMGWGKGKKNRKRRPSMEESRRPM